MRTSESRCVHWCERSRPSRPAGLAATALAPLVAAALLLAVAPAVAAEPDPSPGQQVVDAPPARALGGVLQTEAEDSADLDLGAERSPIASREELWEQRREAKRRWLVREREREDDPLDQNFLTELQERLPFGAQEVVLEDESKWLGFYPILGGFPAGSGLGVGIGWRAQGLGAHLPREGMPNHFDLELEAGVTTVEDTRLSAELTWHNVAGAPFSVDGYAQYLRLTEEKFFGLGPDSLADNRTSFLFEVSEQGIDAWVGEKGRWRIGGGPAFVEADFGSGQDENFPSLEEVFTPDEVPGLIEETTYWRLRGFAELDLRDEPSNPRAGGLYAVRVADWTDGELDHFDFRQYEVEVQQYFPFLRKRRVIALRFLTTLSEASAEDAVPFYFQPVLGSTTLRGFREYRFRDRNRVLLQAEYRWQAWLGLQMALFVDAGKVFPEIDDFGLDDLERVYGIGFRFASSESVFLRLDLAYGPEGFFPWFRFDHAFD